MTTSNITNRHSNSKFFVYCDLPFSHQAHSIQAGTRNYLVFEGDTNTGVNYWIPTTENQLQHNEISALRDSDATNAALAATLLFNWDGKILNDYKRANCKNVVGHWSEMYKWWTASPSGCVGHPIPVSYTHLTLPTNREV